MAYLFLSQSLLYANIRTRATTDAFAGAYGRMDGLPRFTAETPDSDEKAQARPITECEL